MKKIEVGLLGFGTVGSGMVKILLDNREVIESRVGASIAIKWIAARDLERDRGVVVDTGLLTTDAEMVIDDPKVDIVVELIVGYEPAKSFILKSIENGKHVVTANKALLAAHGDEIFSAASRKGVEVGFEASVGGGIPLIGSMKEGLVANRIESLFGILNGTANYILTKMTDQGSPFSEVLKEAQASWYPAPFSSSLSEGPLQRGLDITKGGTWYTTYGILMGGLADAADSLAVIDKLIYRDKKITWDQLLEATRANWQGYENLRQLCINSVPKYGNDDTFADDWAAWVMDTWQDSIDWINTQRDLLPYWGGKWLGKTTVGQTNVPHGRLVSGLPNGHINPNPLADTISPSQGMDRNGPTAVIKSVSKLPTHRLAAGGPMNLRLTPQLLATDRDLDNFASLLRTVEELGVYHIQFNVISSETLRKAMEEPEKYRDLMVRVASYVSYFVDLTKTQQLDIISRTEHQSL